MDGTTGTTGTACASPPQALEARGGPAAIMELHADLP